jgi:acetyl esterase/lipase
MRTAIPALFVTLALLTACLGAEPVAKPAPTWPDVIPLWPGDAPGEKGDIGEEHDTTKPNPKTGKTDNIIRLGNVSKPTLTVFRPPADKATGAAVVVCPGGAYSILAYDLEGTEVCDWLNSIGVTGVLLKYRVPARKGLEKHTAPLQDVQRAMGMVRQHSREWGIDPKRVGVLGFSAGGHLAAALSNNFAARTYPAIDDADKESCRPDFALLIYPAYLTVKGDLTKVAPEMNVSKETPPTFLVQTQDDPIKVENLYTYALALKNAKVPAEVHVYPTGGHGYGLRPSSQAVSSWPQRAGEWMRAQGWLKE